MEQAAPAPTKHARLSPSSSSRWLKCPYSAQHDLPQFESAASDDGTEAHGYAAQVVEGQISLSEVPGKYREGVAIYSSHIAANNVENPIVERLWESLTIDEFFGTLDCLLIKDGTAVLYDYKNGKWPVNAIGNTQLLSYAAIISEHFNIDQFFGIIVQPNTKQQIKKAEFTPDEVAEHRGSVAAAAVSDHKEVGWHCLWCPLLRSKQCGEGVRYAVEQGWTSKYKHLGAKK